MTELHIFTRPYNSKISVKEDEGDPVGGSTAKAAGTGGKVKSPGSDGTSYIDRSRQPVPPSNSEPSEYFTMAQNTNDPVTPVTPIVALANAGPKGLRVDLYDNIAIPITYTILDIRDPDKRKTSWSKTITIPGTKNNNRIFSHIYEISKDGWVTIGNYHVFQGFNPNIRKEVVLTQDGVQVFRGNLQLKKVTKKQGNIEYEVIINGDLTSLFFDVGNTKLTDLDFSEWNHDWSKENIVRSWDGYLCKNSKSINYSNLQQYNAGGGVVRLSRQLSTGRLQITTLGAHGLTTDDWVKLWATGNGNIYQTEAYKTACGTWNVAEIISSTSFTVSELYPVGLLGLFTETITTGHLYVYKQIATGRGYVYPMISWGDEYDYNSFPVTSFIPGIFYKEIWDKIMKKTNSSYDSTFLNSQFFKRLILLQKKESYDVSPNEIAERTFRVGTYKTYTTNCNAGSGTKQWIGANVSYPDPATQSYYNWTYAGSLPGKVKFNVETGGSGTGSYCDGNCDGYTSSVSNWDSSANVWKVRESGEYQIRTTLNITAWVDMNGFVGSGATGISGMDPTTHMYIPGNAGAGPFAANPQGPLGPVNNSGTTGVPISGIYVVVKLMRKRLGVTTYIGQTGKSFGMDSSQRVDGFIYNLYPQVYNYGQGYGWAGFGRYQPTTWVNQSISVESASKYFAAGDEVWVQVEHYCQAQDGGTSYPYSGVGFHERNMTPGNGYALRDIRGNFMFRIESPAVIYNQPSGKAGENSELETKHLLPKDMTCKDFMYSVIKMFNLYIQPDSTTDRKYIIEPRDDFYYTGTGGSGDYVDWTTRMDNDSVDILPMGELLARDYTFENKAETDFWNKKFKEDRGREYMKYTKTINSDFRREETKITVPLGSTIMINNPEGADVVMPSILQKEASGAFKPVSNTQPRCLIWGGMRPYTTGNGYSIIPLSNPQRPGVNGWEMLSAVWTSITATAQGGDASATSSSYHQYPYAGTVDSPHDPQYDLNWFNMEDGDFVYWDKARWADNNLFNAYWKNMIAEISDPSSLVMSANFWLTPSDINGIDFRKIYVINGNYFRLQKIIDYNPGGNTTTKCEFLKLKSQSRFVKKSKWIGEPFDVTTNYDRVVPYTTTLKGPIKKTFIGSGYGNDVSPYGNTTIDVTGKGNAVSKGTKNIKLNGDENVVGDSCVNIQITSGDGNHIIGGQKNVTMIGTSKKLVQESDVTYIHGVRYKNGIAISRANLIDAGQDVVLGKGGLNTTANFVDGGEDVVIGRGSNTVENFIDAGQDYILPDVPELGLSTDTTPNSRTNFANGFAYVAGATQTMTDIVRENRRTFNA